MSPPGFAARLRSGETLFGAWCTLPGPGPARLPAGVHTIRGPDAARFATEGWRLVNVVDDAVLPRDGVAAALERARLS